MARSRSDDNVIPLPDAGLRHATLVDTLEREWMRLIEGLSSDNETPEGAGGSDAASPATPLTVAERVKILSAATAFLSELQKLRPSRTRSGISDLSSQHRGNTAGSRSRRS